MSVRATLLMSCIASLLWTVPREAVGASKITLTESAGLARERFPVEATVPLAHDAIATNRQVQLLRVNGEQRTAVPAQVMKVSSPNPAGVVDVQLLFAADVPAGGSVTYEVTSPKPGEIADQGLQVTGAGMGKSIATGPVTFDLHDPSGQLLAFVPKRVSDDRLTFVSENRERPIHWNPDVWAPPVRWTHTNAWNQGIAFDPLAHKADQPPVGDETTHPFFFEEVQGPLAYRLTRWGKMPLLAPVDASVTYTFFAGSPFIWLQSRVEFHEGMNVNAVRNAELVFSRHQFDTAVWIAKDGAVHTAPCYDYNDRDKSFKELAKLPPDVPCVGLANERKGYGIAYVPLSMKNVNTLTGKPADQEAHFYVRDYDEHGRGHPNNFHYLVRPVVINGDYQPTQVEAGATYEETSAVVVFFLNDPPATRYDELVRWQKLLANPLTVRVE